MAEVFLALLCSATAISLARYVHKGGPRIMLSWVAGLSFMAFHYYLMVCNFYDALFLRTILFRPGLITLTLGILLYTLNGRVEALIDKWFPP